MCDCCGEVLKGKKGMVDINKSNIAIRGMITHFDGQGDYVHITYRADDDMSFCNTECFKNFCNRRIEEYENRRMEQLKQEASDDIVYRRNER